MKIQALTKENFWNDIEARYPKTMERFNEWIDTYKEENDWDKLFNGNVYLGSKELTIKATTGSIDSKHWFSEETASPKYHELPIAMQVGIFFQFTSEFHSEISAADMYHNIKEAIRNDMDNLEQTLNQ